MRIPCSARVARRVGRLAYTYPEVGEDVDVEDLVDLLRGVFQQWVRGHDARVVDEHRHLADVCADLGGQCEDFLPARNIAPAEGERGQGAELSRGANAIAEYYTDSRGSGVSPLICRTCSCGPSCP